MAEAVTTNERITFTPSAVRQAKALIAKQPDPDAAYLRLGVMGGGCSGLQYAIRVETQVREGDRQFEIEGVRVLVDRKSIRYLAGTELDYDLSNLLEGGFRFNNPNAKRSCGCGTSFQIG